MQTWFYRLVRFLSVPLLFIALVGCAATATPTTQPPPQPDPTTPVSAPTAAPNLPELTPELINGYPPFQFGEEASSLSSAYPAISQQSGPPTPVAFESIQAPQQAPAPLPGYASASGVLYSISSQFLLGNFMVYLTPAQGEGDEKKEVPPVLMGPDEQRGDIRVWADQNGVFQVNNIPPGNYYIVLLAPGDFLVALNNRTNDEPRMVTFKADEAQPLGVVMFP